MKRKKRGKKKKKEKKFFLFNKTKKNTYIAKNFSVAVAVSVGSVQF